MTPGVYDWIQVVSGKVVFNPGVYIIRSVNPVTQIGLSVLAGQVSANGVMFYITNTTTYSATSGAPIRLMPAARRRAQPDTVGSQRGHRFPLGEQLFAHQQCVESL